MAQTCALCGKGPTFGHNISHAHNVSSRRFNPNLQSVRALVNGAHQAPQGLHPLHPVEQGHQGRLIVATRASVSTPDAPQAIGPYSQAIRAGQFLFLSGQIPLDPVHGRGGGGRRHARRPAASSTTSAASSTAAGASMDAVVKTTVFLLDWTTSRR